MRYELNFIGTFGKNLCIFIPQLKWIKKYMDEAEDEAVGQKLLPK